MALKRIAIIGSSGMLGSDLVKYLSPIFRVTPINRENYNTYIGSFFDIVINANGNSKRFWANQHPLEDFIKSTVSVYKTIFDFIYQEYIYLSSSDVYENHGDPRSAHEKHVINADRLSFYGLHKLFSEILVRKHVKNYLILRSSMILGKNLKKGPFYDILHKQPLFIAKNSQLQLITTEEVANIIHFLLINNISKEVFNVGGLGTFSFTDVQKYFNTQISFSKGSEKQVYEMSVTKLQRRYPLRASIDYLQQFVDGIN